MEVFSARLKWLRERSNYSQKDMADMLGISQPYYFKFERGTGQPSLEVLAKLPNILNESLDFMLGVENLDRLGNFLFDTYMETKREVVIYVQKLEDNINDEMIAAIHRERLSLAQERLVQAKIEYETYFSLVPFATHIEAELSIDPLEYWRAINRDKFRRPKDGWEWMKTKDPS